MNRTLYTSHVQSVSRKLSAGGKQLYKHGNFVAQRANSTAQTWTGQR